MANTFDYKFNLTGNFSGQIQQMTQATDTFGVAVRKTTSDISGMTKSAGDIANFASRISANLQHLSSSYVDLNANMKDLSAIGGVVGDDLKQIEQYARESAKTFGSSATDAVTGYKLLLSQLSPELAKAPEALKAMGDYRKGGRTGFDTCVNRLQEQCYVLISDFVYMQDRYGRAYGWGVAEYSTPEKELGDDFAEHVYDRSPEES